MDEFIVAENSTTTSLASFEQYVTELRRTMKRQYDRNVNKDLSQQKWQGLFKRNITLLLKQAYEDSLRQLQNITIDSENSYVQALKPFEGIIEELMQYAVQKHRTSCALSNFPDEHIHPSRMSPQKTRSRACGGGAPLARIDDCYCATHSANK